MTLESLLTLLQFSDGLFPAGAYAHSFGLETLIAEGRISNSAGVSQVLRAYLAGSVGTRDAVFAVNALRYFNAMDVDGCVDLDYELDTIKSAAETRAASRQLGRQTLRIISELIDHPLATTFARLATAGATPAHHAIVFGIIGGASEWSPEATAAALLYSSAVTIVGAATRLVPLGQTQAQRLISGAAPLIIALAEEAATRPVENAYTFAPLLEIAAMRHARLNGRLFRS